MQMATRPSRTVSATSARCCNRFTLKRFQGHVYSVRETCLPRAPRTRIDGSRRSSPDNAGEEKLTSPARGVTRNRMARVSVSLAMLTLLEDHANSVHPAHALPDDVSAAVRVLKAVSDGDIPRRQDALRLRLLMPQPRRTRALVDIAEEILRTRQHIA